MSMREGEQLTILDDGHGEWWMARRERTGEEGWVPKGYLATADQYDEHLRQQLEEVVKEMSIDGKEDICMFIKFMNIRLDCSSVIQILITTYPQTVHMKYLIITFLIMPYNNLLLLIIRLLK